MIAIVRLALRRPYTFFVLAILILIFGVLAAVKTPTDIFPDIKIPVIAVVWTYRGLPPDDMSGRVIYYYERQLSSSVNDIEHIESQSLPGIGIVKIFFQPGVDIRTATAQVTSLSQTVLKQMPPGITPPLILNYNASTVPILQLALSSPKMTEQQLFDRGQNFIRPALASVPGTSIPSPYGGKERQIQVDLDPQAMQSKGVSAEDVANALAAQNQIVPAGTAKIGGFEYNVKLNNSPDAIDALNRLPIKSVNGATIYIGDVAHVRDGSPPQRNEVRVDGRRSVLMSVLKSGSASTLAIIDGVKHLLPRLKQSLPSSLHIALLNDQSVFVKAAVQGVVKEGVIAAALTSLMILLFLGSWRSTLIIATSIPLAVLSSIAALSALGQTLNIMTLGGLALAVGILVDDATVTIENINWHLEQGKDVKTAIMDGAHQIVTPAFVSLLCICIVFVPMFQLKGIAGFLFVPMAEAVMFAMIASFVLSRTLVPTLAMYLLKPHDIGHQEYLMESHGRDRPRPSRNPFVRFQHGFERRFARVREGYRGALATALENRRVFVIGFLACVLLSFALLPFLGSNFFPSVDSGEMTLHVRAPVGTRIEDTAALFDHVEQSIRQVIPPDQLTSIVDNIGLPVSGINRAYTNTGGIGPMDGDIYVTLAEKHRPTPQYVRELRTRLPQLFPGSTFSFLPSDIISQILNFGSPAPIDVQVAGPDRAANEVYADELLARMRKVSGLADARLQQSSHYPQFDVNVDRTRADQLGVTEKDVTNTLVTTLSGSLQTAPAFWLNPRNGVSYPLVIQSPQQDVDSLSKLQNIPVTNGKPGGMQILGGLADIQRDDADAVVSHYAIQPSFDVYATTQGRDLGGVAKDVSDILKATQNDLPKGATVTLRGQVQTMNSAFSGLSFGLIGAVVLIYLIIVVNFQSWVDPFVIITALPAALAGIVWMLFATGTPISVPALTGAIMCMGVATANSILVVSFARERLEHSGDAVVAALEAGFSRFRPVLMTALAMIIGMAPMALGLGEGGEQNAPLGRAVIGGLIFATIATLMFVPVVFSIAHGRKAPSRAQDPAGGPISEKSMHDNPEALHHRPQRWLKPAALAGVGLATLIVAVGAFTRVTASQDLKTWTREAAIPTVDVIEPSSDTGAQELVLPGQVQANYDAVIHARVPGYLRKWYVDIGARVKAGQLLAEIDTPELDQQLAQARADLATAQANLKLSALTSNRWSNLLKQDAVSHQEADEKAGDLQAKTALAQAAKANVDRLMALESFKRIVAPFDGVVTARNTDIGALINVAAANDPGLFTVADVHRLRIYVNVPQSDSAAIAAGQTATLSVPEYPGRTFQAKVSSTSGAVGAQSGAVLVELQMDNADDVLKPGDYAQVQFAQAAKAGAIQLPSSAVMFRRKGMAVALVQPDSHVAIRYVTVERDLGQKVELAGGLGPTDKVIDNPPDSIAQGQLVRVSGASSAAASQEG